MRAMKKMIEAKCIWWQELANPARFMQLSAKILPSLSIVTAVVLSAGLLLAFQAPEDYQQGITVKIMFIHVPCAWLAMLCYTLMTTFAIGTLLRHHPLADVALKTAAPIGAVFTALALVTGSLWGKPTWGTWWEWDARLTSMFILLLIYLGIFALSRAFDNVRTSAQATAILTIVGFINIPIIKFSVEWWNTLHQPASILRKGGSAIAPSILIPLLIMAMAFTFVFFVFHLIAMRNEILRRQVIATQKLAAKQPAEARIS